MWCETTRLYLSQYQVPNIALPPNKGTFLALKREHMGTEAHVLERPTPKSARKTRYWLVPKHPGRFRPSRVWFV